MCRDQELTVAIDEVVHYLLDLIGIDWLPEARDEYEGYIPEIFVRTKSGQISEILAYTEWMVVERIGMDFNNSKALEIANILLQWRDLLWQTD